MHNDETGRDLKQRYEHKRDVGVRNESGTVFCHVGDFAHTAHFSNWHNLIIT